MHAPRTAARPVGLVLCHPSPYEYMRQRWVHRRASELAADAGFQVLRFDFLGTGDSAGALDSASFGQWLEDAALAIAELKEATGVQKICLGGSLLAATIAATAVERGLAVDHLLLVDPVFRGAEHLRWLRSLPHGSAGQSGELLGHRLTPAFGAALEGLDLLARPPRCPGKVLIVDSNGAARPLVDLLGKLGQRVCLREAPAARDPYPDDLDEALLSMALPQAISSLLAQELP